MAWAFVVVWWVILLALVGCSGSMMERRVLDLPGGGRITLINAPIDGPSAHRIADHLPQAAGRLTVWGFVPTDEITIQLHATRAAFSRALGGPLPTWLRAVARPDAIHVLSPRIWPDGASDEQIAGLITHEWTHLAIYQRIGRGGRVGGQWPPVLSEGVASLIGGQGAVRPDEKALKAALAGKGAEIDPMNPNEVSQPVFYGVAHRLAEAITRQKGRAWVGHLADQMAHGETFEQAFLAAVGRPWATVISEYRSALVSSGPP